MEDNDINSLIFKNMDTKQKQDQEFLSAEDLAWADSCLIEDPEISETNMDSLKEALLNILDQHVENLHPSTNEEGDSNDVIAPDSFSSLMEEGTSNTKETSIDKDSENENESETESERHDFSFLLKQPFLPNYNDEMMNVKYSDSDDNEGFVFSEFGMEQPIDDIFRVWDLDVEVEEDGLVKELKDALSSNGASRLPKKKGLKMESIDSLVESIADLSLN